MPWTEDDVPHKTREAKSPTARRQWVHVANEVLEKTGDEGRAIREANGVVRDRVRTAVGGTPGSYHGDRQYNAEGDDDGDE